MATSTRSPAHGTGLELPYEVGDMYFLKLLGSGSFGSVYEAIKKSELKPGERVSTAMSGKLAVKVLPRPRAGAGADAAWGRLKDEIKNLHRANGLDFVLPLLGVKKSTNRVYLTFPKCEPTTLQQVIERAKASARADECVLPERLAWRTVRQIAIGLLGLHARGILHRDLKPENILLSAPWPRGQVLLTDLGFSKHLKEDSLAHSQVGTPLFMSPELLTGESHGKPTDMWSLGCVAYQLVCGTWAFKASTREVLMEQVRYPEPPSPRESKSCVSAEYDDMVRGLLKVDAAARLTLPAVLQASEAALRRADCAVTPIPEQLQGYLKQLESAPWPSEGCVAMATVAAVAGLTSATSGAGTRNARLLKSVLAQLWREVGDVSEAEQAQLADLAAEACGKHAWPMARAWLFAAQRTVSMSTQASTSLPQIVQRTLHLVGQDVLEADTSVVLATSAARLCAALALWNAAGGAKLTRRVPDILDRANEEAGRLPGLGLQAHIAALRRNLHVD